MLKATESQLAILNSLLPDNDSSTNEWLLDTAKFAILNKRYPNQDFPTETDSSTGEEVISEVENRYLNLEIRIAVELDSKRGAEGQTVHNENNIERSYSSAGITSQLLNEVTPKGKVF